MNTSTPSLVRRSYQALRLEGVNIGSHGRTGDFFIPEDGFESCGQVPFLRVDREYLALSSLPQLFLNVLHEHSFFCI